MKGKVSVKHERKAQKVLVLTSRKLEINMENKLGFVCVYASSDVSGDSAGGIWAFFVCYPSSCVPSVLAGALS